MKNSSLALGAAMLSLIMTGGIVAVSNASFNPSETNERPQFEREHKGKLGEKRLEMKAIFESNDYQAWADLMAEKPNFPAEISEDTFNKLNQAHELMESGDREGAKEIMNELGIERHRGNKGQRREMFQEMKQVIENNDFNAWTELMTDHPKFDQELITVETFDKFVQAHDLIGSDDKEGAKEIMQELGLGNRR